MIHCPNCGHEFKTEQDLKWEKLISQRRTFSAVDGDVKWWITKFTKDQLMGNLDSCINILKSVKL